MKVENKTEGTYMMSLARQGRKHLGVPQRRDGERGTGRSAVPSTDQKKDLTNPPKAATSQPPSGLSRLCCM